MVEERVYTVAILTVSDRGARGEREDRSGPAVREALAALPGARVVAEALVPDEISAIEEALRRWVREGIDLILTTGGTGFSPRDVTPEATRRVIEREAPGLAEAMRASSLARTPHAMLSRAIAGIAGATLIVNLPGSPRAAQENLEAILPALPHGLSKLKGDPSECGSAA
jgi:molybdopterin adenylyltransferase